MMKDNKAPMQPTASSGTTSNEYDSFVDIYEVWTRTATSTHANLPFYVDAYMETEGPVVELGVGDGRIAVEAARRGRGLIGVDLSAAMLDECRRRAVEAGVLDRLTLLQADFRNFALSDPASLICLPYHSIGHLVTREAKRDALSHIFSQLRPGGRFVFDDFLMTPALVATMRRVELRAEYRSEDGTDVLLWVTSLVDESAHTIKVVTWEDRLDDEGVLAERRYRRLSLSWLEPGEARRLLEDAGFSIEACYGDFRGTPLAEPGAHEQVWIARKPC
jgi:SAM-dependent methyltransferase